jgi:hypothetical protein
MISHMLDIFVANVAMELDDAATVFEEYAAAATAAAAAFDADVAAVTKLLVATRLLVMVRA